MRGALPRDARPRPGRDHRRPVHARRRRGAAPWRRQLPRPLRADLLRLHPLRRRVPADADGDVRGPGPVRSRCQARAAGLHHGRSRTRHAGSPATLRGRLLGAPGRPDRDEPAARRRRAALPRRGAARPGCRTGRYRPQRRDLPAGPARELRRADPGRREPDRHAVDAAPPTSPDPAHRTSGSAPRGGRRPRCGRSRRRPPSRSTTTPITTASSVVAQVVDQAVEQAPDRALRRQLVTRRPERLGPADRHRHDPGTGEIARLW